MRVSPSADYRCRLPHESPAAPTHRSGRAGHGSWHRPAGRAWIPGWSITGPQPQGRISAVRAMPGVHLHRMSSGRGLPALPAHRHSRCAAGGLRRDGAEHLEHLHLIRSRGQQVVAGLGVDLRRIPPFPDHAGGDALPVTASGSNSIAAGGDISGSPSRQAVVSTRPSVITDLPEGGDGDNFPR